MIKSFFFSFLLFASCTRLFSQSESEFKTLKDKGETLFQERNYQEAVTTLEQAQQMGIKLYGEDGKQLKRVYYLLGSSYFQMNDQPRAIQNLLQLEKVITKDGGREDASSGLSYLLLGGIFQSQSNDDKAFSYFQKAAKVMNTLGPEDAWCTSQQYRAYMGIGSVYARRGTLEKAIEQFQTAEQLFLKLPQINEETLYWIRSQLIDVYEKSGNYEMEIAYLNKNLPVLVKVEGDQSGDVAYLHSKLGLAYLATNEFSNSVEHFEKLLSINQVLHSGASIETVSSSLLLIVALNKAGDFTRLVSVGEAHLADAVNLLGSDNQQMAMYYYNLGLGYYWRGRHADALGVLEKAEKIYTRLKQVPNMADGYTALGNCHFALSHFKIAQEYYEKVKKLNPPPDVMLACHNNIANIYTIRGNFSMAFEEYSKALELFPSPEENKDMRATLYMNMGVLLTNRGESTKALEYLNNGLKIRKSLKTDSIAIGQIYINIGACYNRLKDYSTCLNYTQKALALFTHVYGEQSAELIPLYNNIGAIYSDMGDYPKAIEYKKKGLQLMREAQQGETLNATMLYTGLGQVYKKSGDLVLASENFNQALRIAQKVFGKKHPVIAGIYNDMGMIDFYRDSRKSLSNFQNALISNCSTFDNSSIYNFPPTQNYFSAEALYFSLTNKAGLFLNMDGKDNAEKIKNTLTSYQHTLEAQKLLDQTSNTVSEADRMQLGTHIEECNFKAVAACMNLYIFTQDKGYLTKAFQHMENNKTFFLRKALADVNAKSIAGIPDSLLQKERSLNETIFGLEKNIAEERMLATPNEDKLKTLNEEVFVLKRNKETLLAGFEKNFPSYFAMKYAHQEVDVAKLQQTFLAPRPHTAIVEYMINDNAVYAVIVTADTLRLLQLGEVPNLERSITGIRKTINNNLSENFVTLSNNLYKHLWAKIDEVLKQNQITDVIIVPEGPLSYLPFETLIETTERGADEWDLPYLIKVYKISYALSAAQLKNEDANPLQKTFVSFAPVFSDDDTDKINHTLDLPLASRAMTSSGQKVNALLGSKTEVENITSLFSQHSMKSKNFMFKEANEANVKQASLKEYSYIHFATHGFVDSDNPELSGLLLYYDQKSKEDGILYSGEIYNLQFNADLITLSACETGLGKMVRGEGIVGLTRGLIFSGAKNVMVSLWKVDDASTSKLMVTFYDQLLQGKSKSESVRSAKLSLIETPQFRAPNYWAAFILIAP